MRLAKLILGSVLLLATPSPAREVEFRYWPQDVPAYVVTPIDEHLIDTATGRIEWQPHWDRVLLEFRPPGAPIDRQPLTDYFNGRERWPSNSTYIVQMPASMLMSRALRDFWWALLPLPALAAFLVLRRRHRPPSAPTFSEQLDDTDPWIGHKVGPYIMERALGEGGFASVYRTTAEDGTPVAVKIVRPALANDPVYRQRFLREVRLLSSLQHPSIVRIYDFSSMGDPILYYAMEYIEGTTLRDIIPTTVHNPTEFLRYFSPLLEAVQTAHEHGIVHRDLKPENVMVTRQGEIRVMDFGIARGGNDTTLTQTGAFMGTVAYAAPELATEKGVNPLSDQYSLGIMAYEMLHGAPPYDHEDFIQIIIMHQTETPVPLEVHWPEIPPALAEAIHRMLQRSPSDRFPSCRDARLAIERAILQAI